jgi:hypothetical protein
MRLVPVSTGAFTIDIPAGLSWRGNVGSALQSLQQSGSQLNRNPPKTFREHAFFPGSVSDGLHEQPIHDITIKE